MHEDIPQVLVGRALVLIGREARHALSEEVSGERLHRKDEHVQPQVKLEPIEQ